MTSIQVHESYGVDICVLVFEPNISRPIEFEFSIYFATSLGQNGNSIIIYLAKGRNFVMYTMKYFSEVVINYYW